MADDVGTADDLYALDPTEFVAARDALAKRLRGAGDKQEAARVAKLRRPSTTAAALNRAAREHADLLEEALAAGQALREATEAALAGDATNLRSATSAERAASDRFVAAAASYLGGGAAGAPPRLAGTLRAAVVDESVADELRRGVLAADREASAFGFASDMDVGSAPVRPARPAKKPAADAARVAEEERRRFEERRRRAEQQRELERLERSADRLARRADEAEEAARHARTEADAAAAEAAKARQQLT